MIKQPGLCTLCATPCFEVRLRYDDKFRHLNGRIRALGKPLPNAWKVTLLLLDGSRMDLTVCETCVNGVESKVPELWGNVLESYREELSDPYRQDVGLNLFPEDRKLEEMVSIAKRPPVGIFYIKRWSDG